jgi:uncharacterized protein YkwD
VRSILVHRFSRFAPAVITLALAACLPSAAHAAGGCAGADRPLAQSGATAARSTTVCLLNVRRHAAGLRSLRTDAKLARASKQHSVDMVANRYFAHDSLSGARFSARIARTGWMNGREVWTVGENLAWGTGDRSTPRATVEAWMHSAPHRRNILNAHFRSVGVGMAAGVPLADDGTGATYTTDFGG